MNIRLVIFCFLLVNNFSVFASEFSIGLSVWSGYPESVRGFKDGLASKGLVEGENVRFIQGEVGADKKLQLAVAEKFKAAKVNLVYSLTTPGTTIVKSVMPATTPIVFSIVTYPADSGLIESFEYSGNNLVGTSNYIPLQHYINLLKAILPMAKRVAIFHRKGEPNSKIQASNMLRHLKREGISVIDIEVENIEKLKTKANELIGNVDAFITTTDTLMQSGGEAALVEVSLMNGIPILSSNKKGIEGGSSFGPVADFYTLGKMSGIKAAKILKDKTLPTRIESELQDPPLALVNRASIEKLGIKLSNEILKNIHWTDE